MQNAGQPKSLEIEREENSQWQAATIIHVKAHITGAGSGTNMSPDTARRNGAVE